MEFAVQEEKKEATESRPTADGVVPQLEAAGVTFGDLETAIKVLNAVAKLTPGKAKQKKGKRANNHKRKEGCDGKSNGVTAAAEREDEKEDPGVASYKHSNLRPFRKALAGCLALHQRTMYQGQSEEEYYQQRIEQRTLKRQRIAERDMQKNYIATTQLRKGRVERLRALQQDAESEERDRDRIMALMIPDGHVDTTRESTAGGATKMLTENGSGESSSSGANKQEEKDEPCKLPLLRSCYVCKIRYRELHSFYDQLCPPCAALNWTKRLQTADLTGRVAVVTGSRVKIGYQVCLKLLRAGGTVVATTRFPNAAVAAYRQETDFDAFRDRLHVYGLDLRDVAGLEAFVRFLKQRYTDTGIDVLINNACQTIRRPAGYYRPLLEREQQLWQQADSTHQSVLQKCREFEQVRRRIVVDHNTHQQDAPDLQLLPEPVEHQQQDSKPPAVETKANGGQAVAKLVSESVTAPFETTGLSHSAAMSQMIILPEDVGVNDDILPPGLSDVNGQQLDLRKTNSWLLKMEEVSTPELMETFFVNGTYLFAIPCCFLASLH